MTRCHCEGTTVRCWWCGLANCFIYEHPQPGRLGRRWFSDSNSGDNKRNRGTPAPCSIVVHCLVYFL